MVIRILTINKTLMQMIELSTTAMIELKLIQVVVNLKKLHTIGGIKKKTELCNIVLFI